MFVSYDVWEYGNRDHNAFYEDAQRSSLDTMCANRNTENRFKRRYRNDVAFEEYAYAAISRIDIDILFEHEQKCWRFLRVVFDHERRVPSEVAAVCINRMFSRNLRTSMIKYHNTKKMKATLQELRGLYQSKFY